jgi:hypothetical protein
MMGLPINATAPIIGKAFFAASLKNSLLLCASFFSLFSILFSFCLLSLAQRAALFNGKQSGASQTYPYFQRLGLDSREMKISFSKDCSTVYVRYNEIHKH